MPKKNKVYNCHEFAEDDPYRQYCKLWVVRSLLQENPGATMGDLRERIMQRAIDDLSLKDTLYILMGKSPKLAQYMNRELTDQAFATEVEAVQNDPNQAILVSALRDPQRYGIPEDLQNDDGVNSVLIDVASEYEYNGETAAEFIAECVQETYAEIDTRTVVSIVEPHTYIENARERFAEDNELQYPFNDLDDMHFEPDETVDDCAAFDMDRSSIGYVYAFNALEDMTDEQVEELIDSIYVDEDYLSDDFTMMGSHINTVADVVNDQAWQITGQDLAENLPGFYTLAIEDIAKALQAEVLTDEAYRKDSQSADAITIQGVFYDPNCIMDDDGMERYLDCEGGENIPLNEYLDVCRERAKEAAAALSYTYEPETETLKISAGDLDYIPADMFNTISDKFPTKNIIIDESIRAVEHDAIYVGHRSPVETVSFPDVSGVDQNAVNGTVQKLMIDGKEYHPILPQEMQKMSLLACYQLEKQFNENHIPYTKENIESAKDILRNTSDLYAPIPGINNEVPHTGNSVTTIDYFAAACREFVRSGCPMKDFYERLYAKNDPRYRELVKKTAQEFSENYHRVPKISDDVAYAIFKGYVSPDFVEKKRFEYKRMRSAIAKRTPMIPALAVMGAIDDPNLQTAVLNSPVICQAAKVIQNDRWDNINPNFTVDYMKFLLNHPNMNQEIAKIAEAAHCMPEFTINEHTTTNDVRRMKSMEQAVYDLRGIKNKYPGFSLASLKSNLEGPTIYQDGYKAYFLPADDIRQVVIGRDTVCCQHLGGAGETSMMYGLLNPDAGFFVVERLSDHNIVAQGESWLTEDKKTLCFDNIEFANDRDMRSFAPIVAKFAQECPYENVVTGTGYNEFMTSGQIRLENGITPPKCAEYDKMVDEDLYTDAGRKIGVIKEDDVVEPFFANAYAEKEGHPLVSDKTKEAEEVTHDEEVAHDPSDESRSSLSSLIGAAEAESPKEPETTETSHENFER